MRVWIAVKAKGRLGDLEDVLAPYAAHGRREQGDWTLVGGDHAPHPLPPNAKAALSTCESAVALAGDQVPGIVMDLFQRGSRPVTAISMPIEMDPFGEGPSDPAALLEWVRTNAPGPINEAGIAEIWLGTEKGSEDITGLLICMGFNIDRWYG